ncbi:MAG TPA: ribonuclease Y [Candidatus Faecenecus gallistercoris]|uniref:Ribonuclease Y n=1 Tax=Candidatus Faecenecus gallistercoris TaxID=2840793 RepID=A0A9D0YZD2_9FIRM|nr:ribonuclease Y [Candidatus Faecenecus gallistercoris]
MDMLLISILALVIGSLSGTGCALLYHNIKGKNNDKAISEMLEKAKKDADKMKREALLEAKEEEQKRKIENDKLIKEKKAEIKENEDRLIQRENNIDKRDQLLQKRETTLDERENKIFERQKEIQDEQARVDEIKQEQLELLEKISGFDKEKARKLVMNRVEEAMQKEIAEYIKEQENNAKMEADKKAKDLIVTAMQRFAADIANDQTITVVTLPNDEMKGRIIGREGRNIRTLEAITGVDLIIDDTPEAVVLSSFDPLRREIARVTLETLMKDGRIHPTRIEELYDKVCKDMKAKILEYGNDALFELGLTKVDPDLIEIIGRLHFRSSYGQNALAHSIEVANLAGLMAGELGENVTLAKRAGLLHDIGKAIDHEMEGSHVEIGVDIAKKFHENPVVVNAIASHHGDTEPTSVISVLVAIADALSASRPGARNDTLENYIKRLEQLENIGNDIPGVEKTYAVQAGRELRVIVKPDEIDDITAHKVARDIKEKIEQTMQYPGTIKVTVVRETRAQEEAR